MKWLLFVGLALVAVIVIVALVGSTLPRGHIASRTLRVKRSPQDVWPVISDMMAKSDVPVDILENDPPRRLVSRVKATEKMFGGTWTVTVSPAPDGSNLTITEDGWVANPVFRFVSRFVIGHHATMDGMLKGVAKHFSEGPVLSGE